jgi:phage baseplate assembly protein gpV
MHTLANSLKIQAAAMDAQQGQSRWGIVSSVNSGPNGGPYTAKVRMQPEDVLTGWLPVLSSMVGAGWGMVSPPYPGQQVFVIPDCGDHAHGVIVGATWSQPAGNPTPQPPGSVGGAAAPVLPGEFGVVSKPGSYIRGSNDGSLLLVAGTTSITMKSADNSITIVAGGMSVTLASTGITINGGGQPVHVTNGDLHEDGGIIAGFGGPDQVGLQTHHQTGPGGTPTPLT